MTIPDVAPWRVIGRYAIYDELASGGMATVHLGRLLGSGGFSRAVAIKRLHAHLAKDPEFVKMFLDEARVAARIRHPNVVPVLDVVHAEGEIFLVMEYVAGETLARLVKVVQARGEHIPVPIAAAIVVGVLRGLHAAHEATDEHGAPLCIVHRDVTPPNIMVGRDGVAQVLDFGVAKAAGQLQTTREGQIKGKVGYMPPEQIRGGQITRAVDIYAATVVLWELLVGERLFGGETEANVLERALFAKVEPPGERGADPVLDAVVMHGLAREPGERFASARDMARAIEAAVPIASAPEVGEWLETLASELLVDRQRKVAAIESMAEPAVAAERPQAAGDVSEATPAPEPRRRASRWARLAWVSLALGCGTIGFEALRWRAPHATAAPVAPEPPVLSASAVPSAAPTSVGSSGTPPLQASSSPSSVVRGPAATSSGGRRTGGHPEIVRDIPAWQAGARASAAAKAGCTPPYTIDADGVKQYKVQCL